MAGQNDGSVTNATVEWRPVVHVPTPPTSRHRRHCTNSLLFLCVWILLDLQMKWLNLYTIGELSFFFFFLFTVPGARNHRRPTPFCIKLLLFLRVCCDFVITHWGGGRRRRDSAEPLRNLVWWRQIERYVLYKRLLFLTSTRQQQQRGGT